MSFYAASNADGSCPQKIILFQHVKHGKRWALKKPVGPVANLRKEKNLNPRQKNGKWENNRKASIDSHSNSNPCSHAEHWGRQTSAQLNCRRISTWSISVCSLWLFCTSQQLPANLYPKPTLDDWFKRLDSHWWKCISFPYQPSYQPSDRASCIRWYLH